MCCVRSRLSAQGLRDHLRRILKHGQESIKKRNVAWAIQEKAIDCTKNLSCLRKDDKFLESGELEEWETLKKRLKIWVESRFLRDKVRSLDFITQEMDSLMMFVFMVFIFQLHLFSLFYDYSCLLRERSKSNGGSFGLCLDGVY